MKKVPISEQKLARLDMVMSKAERSLVNKAAERSHLKPSVFARSVLLKAVHKLVGKA